MNNGKYETWSYTQIDQSVTAGLVFAGNPWSRSGDKFGVAGGINGLSSAHANYLKGGGSGIILGDGTLNYGNEGVFELFYSLKFTEGIWLTGDYQFCVNPGFNKDRGPVWNIVGFRAHIEF
jgi:high affinity Mn2+ porin